MKHYSQSLTKVLATFAIVGAMGFATVASAHEADCPYCKLKIVQNTKDMDNEVVLKMGNKRIEYRCITCVFLDQGRYKKDIIVYAPSEKKGEPVVLKRTDGKWSAPEGAVFLNSFKKHADCASLSRAFTSKSAFEKYVATHGAKDAKPLPLADFMSAVAKSAG